MPTDKVISLLGLKKAGKTTYLSVLNLALALEESPWRIRPVGDTIKVMAELTTKMFVHGEYPEATTEEKRMTFVVEKEATMLGLKPGAQFRLHAADVPGESIKGVAGAGIYQDFYEEYVKNSSGIIFLLDSQHKWIETEQESVKNADLYLPLFETIINQIQEQTEETRPYIAFCVTKMDQVASRNSSKRRDIGNNFDADEYFEGIEELAAQILGFHTKAIIDHAFDNDHVRWLPVSATGFIMVGNERKSQLDPVNNRIINPRDIKPIGVAESLEWVLDMLADDDEDVRIRRTRGKRYADTVKGFRKLFGI
jgi:hypothetical protein